MNWNPLLILGIAALLLGMSAPAPGKGKRIAVRRIASGTQSRRPKATRHLIRTQQDWERLWKQAGREKAPPLAVDWRKEMVLALFMGRRPTAGYSIEVERVERIRKALVVTVRSHSPGPGDLVAQVITTPFYVGAIPRSDLPVKFVDAKQR